MSNNAVGVVYHSFHHFLTEATWDLEKVNDRRLQVMQQCSQTKINRGFTSPFVSITKSCLDPECGLKFALFAV